MPRHTTAWLRMPEWESDDEYAGTKALLWGILVDAVQKSIMADAPSSTRGAKSSPSLMAEMTEARVWLMDDTTVLAGTDLGSGLIAGATKHTCLSALNISDMVLKQLLCPLWLREDKSIGSTLWKHLKAARAALKSETEYNREVGMGSKRSGGLKQWKAAREHAMLMRASEVRKQSMAWVEE
jgi:hypothetical protein